MENVQLITDRLKTTKSCHKSYAFFRRRELELKVDDWVFLKVFPTKEAMRFGKKGNISPRYVDPCILIKRIGKGAYELELLDELPAVHPLFHIIKRIGKGEYELELLDELPVVHPLFHISLLKNCMGFPASIVPLESVEVKDSLFYVDLQVEILDRQVRTLRNNEFASVKVFWMSHSIEELFRKQKQPRKPSILTSLFPISQVIEVIVSLQFSSHSCVYYVLESYSLSL